MTENNSKINAETIHFLTINNHSNVNPSGPKKPKKNFQSAANIAGVIAALMAVLTLIHTINKEDDNSTNNDKNSKADTTVNNHKDSSKINKSVAPDIKNNLKIPIIIPTVKPLPSSFAVLKIDDELNHFDAELSKRVADILNQKNYKDIHVSSNPSSNSKNWIIGKLTLSNIDSSKRTDFYTIYKYTFALEIMFSDAGGHICDQRKYSSSLSLRESNPQNISKEQAIIDLLAKLAMEKDIPFCNK